MNDSTRRIIEMLLAALPDNRHDDDESWGWCWNELSDDAQEQVVETRHETMQFLGRSADAEEETHHPKEGGTQYICAYCDCLGEVAVEVLTSGAKLTCNECGETTDVYLCARRTFSH